MLIKEIQTLENNQKSKEKSEELEEILLDLIRKNYNYTKAERNLEKIIAEIVLKYYKNQLMKIKIIEKGAC
ncbi:39_t:CDS:2 [Entrophospora sp. SA101]|nr:39_t:CDS:2 [Entrophospora sp. SA101]